MTHYVVTTHLHNDRPSEDGGQYEIKKPAMDQFQRLADLNIPVRLVFWDGNESVELDRAHFPPAAAEPIA
ncbi:MAG: hypothetical protein JWM57_983 [Phycisphaerales bacterium]|nr:hypothetical protein [Phycisphaerales bacterium]